jgi:hypothetical protein
MKRLASVLAMGLVAAAVGCTEPEMTEPIILRDSGPEPRRLDMPASGEGVDEVYQASPVPVPEGTRFFNAGSSKECPQIKVTTFQGETVELQPGTAGYVTLVVFWSMEWPAAKAVARHVSDLQRKYAEFGVRAVGLTFNTPSVNLADQFAGAQGIRYPFYLDDVGMSGLRRLAGKVGADEKKAMPAVFIVDRRLRLRFYRPGFAFTISEKGPREGETAPKSEDPRRKDVLESVPEGQMIEDYLKIILGER